MIATYQIGVDILGFPIYLEHNINEVSVNKSRFFGKSKEVKTIIVKEKVVKQH